MDLRRLALNFTVLLSVAAHADFVPYSDPMNSGGWILNESVSDEFDGNVLDEGKWQILGKDGDYYGRWKGRAPSQFSPHNIQISEGFLTIYSKWDPGFSFEQKPFKNGFSYGDPAPITTGAIISKAKFKHGYLEMRCKAADGPVSSSFWTTGKNGELDVFEHFGANSDKLYSDTRYHTSFHDWRVGSETYGKRIWTNDHQLDFRVAADFHVYGLEWDPEYVKMYVDGRLINCVTRASMGEKWVMTHEQMVWIDSETFEWEMHPSELKERDFGDGLEFIVDYCRIWQRAEASTGCEGRLNLLRNPSFENGATVWTGDIDLVATGFDDEVSAQLKGGATIEQTVEVKPNTTYVLSGWVKSPKVDHSKLWLKLHLGAKDFGGDEIDTIQFFPYLHEKSLQFKTGSTNTSVVIYAANKSRGNVAIVDDLKLVEAPSLKD
ncbi:MAG: family 16 glycosylhydrolase [Opitutaceae bacterium]